MKIYFLIISTFWSNIILGQTTTVDLMTVNPAKIHKIPLSSDGLFDFSINNQMLELFPKDTIKKYGYKAIKIYKENNADIASIHVQVFPSILIEFDDAGWFKNSREGYEFYNYEAEKVISKHLMNFGHGQFIELSMSDFPAIEYSYSNGLITKEDINYENIKKYKVQSIDDKGRLYKIEHIALRGEDTTKYIVQNLQYFEDDFYAIVTGRYQGNKTDTIFFNENWQPIKQVRFWRKVPSMFKTITYNEKQQIIQYHEEYYKPKNNSRGILLNKKIIQEGEIINFEFKKVYDDLAFHYDKNGLIEKIIHKTDEGIYQFRVYYVKD